MPWFLFLMSLMVSTSMFLVSQRVVRDVESDRAFVASEAAFWAAESGLEEWWSDAVVEDSAEQRGEFQSLAGLKEEGGDDDRLTLNQEVAVNFVQRSFSSDPDPFLSWYEQSSGELFLSDAPVDQAIEALEVDYCLVGESCPELVIDWFRIGKDFQFQKIREDHKQEPTLMISKNKQETNCHIFLQTETNGS